jgi:type IV secretion system protein VirD4
MVDPAHHLYCGMFEHKKRLLPVFDDSDRMGVMLGSTRRGKDSGFIVQWLAWLRESIVVLDPAGEIAAITKRYRERHFGPCIVLNPYGVLTSTHPHLISQGYNPLMHLKPRDPYFFSEATGIGEASVPRASVRDSHWDTGAVALETVLTMWETWLKAEGKRPTATLRHVNRMFTTPYTKVGNTPGLVDIMKQIGRHADRQMAGLTPRFIADDGDDREVRNVIATAAGKLFALNDEALLADTDKHPMINGKPFNFEMLKHYGPAFERPVPGRPYRHNGQVITVYIILPDHILKTHAIWLRLIVSAALNTLKRSEPGLVRPHLIFNEVGHLGYLEALDSAMGMIAKKGVKILTAWQSLSQISRIYGEHGRETFLSGAGSTLAFRADDMETAEYLCKRLGRRTEVVSHHSVGSASSSKTDSPAGFPLMHPDQIMNLPPRQVLSWVDRLPYPALLTAPGYFDMPIKGLDPNPYFLDRGA